MARSIQEGDATTSLNIYMISSDVLGDPTRLTSNHICVPNTIQQEGFSMVNMP